MSPSASEAVGRKLYALPAFTEATGAPLMTGAVLGGEFTAIEKAGNAAVAVPSFTRGVRSAS